MAGFSGLLPRNAHIALFRCPRGLAIPEASPPRPESRRPCSTIVPCAFRKRAGARGPSCRTPAPMNDRHQLARIGEASGVSATDVRIGHVVPALGYALADTLNAALRIVQTNIEESGEKGAFQRRPDRIARPVAGQGGFDCEALAGSKVARASAKSFPSGGDSARCGVSGLMRSRQVRAGFRAPRTPLAGSGCSFRSRSVRQKQSERAPFRLPSDPVRGSHGSCFRAGHRQ